MFDALLSFTVVLGIGAIWRIGQGDANARLWVWLGVVVGAGVLAKGPVVLVHLLPALLSLRFWAAAPPTLRSGLRGSALALLVALGLVALWLVPALATGDAAFRRELLWTQTAARVTGDLGHGRPFWFLLALLPVVVFPWGWSLRLWAALPAALKADRAVLFCMIWVGGAIVVLSVVGGKQMHYLLPEMPGLGLIMARVLGPAWASRRWSLAPLGPLALAVAMAVIALGGADQHLGAGVVITPLEAAMLAASFLGLAVAGVLLPTGIGHTVMGLGLPIILHLVIAFGGVGALFETQPIAEALRSRMDDGVAVVGMPYNADFNFKARMTKPVAVPEGDAAMQAWMQTHPKGSIVGPTGRAGFEKTPDREWIYRGRPIGLWKVSDLTGAEASGP
jgi:4-amino-4-deoxy-L-arabinose transferase-like glycosyltransferase